MSGIPEKYLLSQLINIANGVRFSVMDEWCHALLERGLVTKTTEINIDYSLWDISNDGLKHLEQSENVMTCMNCSEYKHLLTMEEYHGVILCPNCIESHRRGLLSNQTLYRLKSESAGITNE